MRQGEGVQPAHAVPIIHVADELEMIEGSV